LRSNKLEKKIIKKPPFMLKHNEQKIMF
jgi:hypothetical protein